jgi:hypothetical protein
VTIESLASQDRALAEIAAIAGRGRFMSTRLPKRIELMQFWADRIDEMCCRFHESGLKEHQVTGAALLCGF